MLITDLPIAPYVLGSSELIRAIVYSYNDVDRALDNPATDNINDAEQLLSILAAASKTLTARIKEAKRLHKKLSEPAPTEDDEQEKTAEEPKPVLPSLPEDPHQEDGDQDVVEPVDDQG